MIITVKLTNKELNEIADLDGVCKNREDFNLSDSAKWNIIRFLEDGCKNDCGKELPGYNLIIEVIDND